MSSTEQTYTASTAGVLTADITSHVGEVIVRTGQTVKHATVRVHTTGREGPVADAVRDTKISEGNGKLSVRVPQLPGGGNTVITAGGNMVVSGISSGSVIQSVGNVSSVQVGGSRFNFSGGVVSTGSGDVIIGGRKVVENGRVVAEAGTVVSGGGTGTIKVEVLLPAMSSLRVETTNGELTVRGDLNELGFDSRNGSVQAEGVQSLDASTHNGSILVDRVQEELEAGVHNGSVTIGAYDGSRAHLRAHNGDITLTATPESTGKVTARTHNGNIRLRGAEHLDVRTSTHNGRVW